jgi:hypothetical protein
MAITYKTKIINTTPYTITTSDEVIFVNVAGPATIILPSQATNDGGKFSYYIKDFSGLAGSNPITIVAPNGKTIDGVSFAMLNGGYSHIQVIYDGVNWKTIS